MRASAVILAAGRSSRMGEPKLALPFRGSSVLGCVLKSLARPGIAERVVVLGHDREVLARIAGEAGSAGPPVRIVANRDPEGDMASSVKIGVRATAAGADWILITPGDLPAFRPDTVDRLVEEAESCSRLKRPPLLVPVCAGRGGHPLALPAALRADVLGSPPGWTLRDLLHGVSYPVREVEVDDEGIFRDLDAPADLRELE